MLIIIEGCDGAGKSTLAQRIAADIKTSYPTDTVDIWHAGPPTDHPLDAYERPLYDYRPGTGRHIICDRWHVGEWIYPEVLNRPTVADTAVWRHVDMFLRSRGAVLVHAAIPIKQLVANIRKRGDDLIRVRQLQGIAAAYSAMMRASHMTKIRYTRLGDSFAPNQIIRTALWAETQAQPLNQFVTYVGSPTPRYLLLGDVRHDLRHDVQSIIDPMLTIMLGPAFGPYRGTSGHFLLTHLPHDVVRHAGLANACDVDDTEDLWRTLGQPRILTLGKNADRQVTWTTAKTHAHPQYVRRFQAHYGTRYGHEIMDLLHDHPVSRVNGV